MRDVNVAIPVLLNLRWQIALVCVEPGGFTPLHDPRVMPSRVSHLLGTPDDVVPSAYDLQATVSSVAQRQTHSLHAGQAPSFIDDSVCRFIDA